MQRRQPSRLGPRVEWQIQHATQRFAFTLAELLVALCVLSILLGMSIMRIGAAADRSAVRAAAADAAAVFIGARNAAIYRRSPITVLIDTTFGTLVTRADTLVIGRRNLEASYGVRISCTRDSMSFDVRGLGSGVANLSLRIRRGNVTDTLFLSRLGRVRY
jgi:prepilin-type N-terminal cleavage/methylation domain-containing protein